MIVVGGFNTAIDRFLTVGELRTGVVRREDVERLLPQVAIEWLE